MRMLARPRKEGRTRAVLFLLLENMVVGMLRCLSNRRVKVERDEEIQQKWTRGVRRSHALVTVAALEG